MAEILSVSDAEVKIGEEDGKVITVPIASLRFANPREGDIVEVFRDGKNYIIRRKATAAAAEGERVINKHLFVWVGTFLFGGFGVDRFMRGQTGLGVLKLLLTLIGWVPLGLGTFIVWVWVLVDWIIALTKAYGSAYGADENFTFDDLGNYLK